jgi:hypothetical protein
MCCIVSEEGREGLAESWVFCASIIDGAGDMERIVLIALCMVALLVPGWGCRSSHPCCLYGFPLFGIHSQI